MRELADYPAARGRHVRSGARQSIPSSNMDNCAGVSATLPSLAEGQTNRPLSRRFMNMHAPCLRLSGGTQIAAQSACGNLQAAGLKFLCQVGISVSSMTRKASSPPTSLSASASKAASSGALSQTPSAMK